MDKVLHFAKKILKDKIDKNSVVVDATCGNGNDTLFLAKSCAKRVYGFDVQKLAIERTKKLLKENNVFEKCDLFLDSHSNIDNYISEDITGAIFNLGYLPQADHTITTLAKTTIMAIKKVIKLLKVNGIIVVVVYYGHKNGKEEKSELLKYLKLLNQKEVEVLKYQFINQKNNAPFLVAIEKIK